MINNQCSPFQSTPCTKMNQEWRGHHGNGHLDSTFLVLETLSEWRSSWPFLESQQSYFLQDCTVFSRNPVEFQKEIDSLITRYLWHRRLNSHFYHMDSNQGIVLAFIWCHVGKALLYCLFHWVSITKIINIWVKDQMTAKIYHMLLGKLQSCTWEEFIDNKL